MPEVTDKYIRIPVWRGYSKIVATITISSSKGIKALLGRVPNTKKTRVATYLFLRSKGWTMSKAKAWVKAHKKSMKNSKVKRFSFSMPIVKAYEIKDKEGNKKKIIEGVASTTDKDLHGDRMSAEAIKSMADSLKTVKDKDGTLNAEHSKSWMNSLGEIKSLNANKKKELEMKATLNKTSKAQDLWYLLTEKKKKLGLSVGGFVKSYRIEIDEKTKEYMRVFEKVVLDHIAVVSEPANPKTWVSAIAKSVNSIQLGVIEEVDNLINNDEDMAKEKNVKVSENELEEKKVKAEDEDAEKKEVKKDAEDTKENTSETDESSEGKAKGKEQEKSEGETEDSSDESSDEEGSKESSEEDDKGETDEETDEDKEGSESESTEEDTTEEKGFATKEEVDSLKSEMNKGFDKIKELLTASKKKVTKKSKEVSKTKVKTEKVDAKNELKEQVEALTKTVETLKKTTSNRKTVETDKFDEGDTKKKKLTLEKAFKAAEKKYKNDPDKLFAIKGQIRKEYK